MPPEKKVLYIQPRQIGVGVTPDGRVSLLLGKPPADLGFDPALELAADLKPKEARELADLLVRKALEAEGAPTQH